MRSPAQRHGSSSSSSTPGQHAGTAALHAVQHASSCQALLRKPSERRLAKTACHPRAVAAPVQLPGCLQSACLERFTHTHNAWRCHNGSPTHMRADRSHNKACVPVIVHDQHISSPQHHRPRRRQTRDTDCLNSICTAQHSTAQMAQPDAAAEQSQTTPKASRACFCCKEHVFIWPAHKEARAKPLLVLRWHCWPPMQLPVSWNEGCPTAPPPPGSMGLPSAYSVYPGTAKCVRLNLQRM